MINSSRTAMAADDLAEGWGKRWMWTALAMQDIRLRYRGSSLGPFWLTITTLVMIGTMGIVYSRILKMDVQTYLPYLTVGLTVWQFIATTITEGCQTYLGMQHIVQQVKLPLSLHAYRTVCRNVIVLGHTFVIVPIVIWLYGVKLNADVFLVIPAFMLVLVNCVCVCVVLGMICARFRDVPSIITNIVQVAFFVTPVFWTADALGPNQWVAELNPLFAAIDVIRAPLLGKQPAELSWVVLSITTVVDCSIAFIFFARFRQRIAFWI